ncbi:MAG: chemotaxis protein CheW [Symploca sp. SIO2E6]|nr:chemotaxis protein CheW [Symploca sp. SIO2E6]
MTKVDKFIVFKIADYLLALPMSDVLKVINFPPSGNLGAMGLVQLGRHTIRVFDLHEQLNSGEISSLANHPHFLLIIRNPQQELCGIAVDDTPNLMELPLEMMRSVPKSFGQSSISEMVSHTVVLSEDAVTTTIFLLDVQRLFC